MKKRWYLLSAITLLLALLMSVSVLAEDTMYAAKEKVNVYEEKDKDSNVVKELKGCDEVKVKEKDGSWIKVGTADDKEGWVDANDLSEGYPQSLCPHEWGEWQEAQSATCVAPKYEQRFCKRCGIMEEREGDLGPHSFGDWKVTKEATCTQEGQKTSTCSVCGKEQTETIPKTDHKFSHWTMTRRSTCTQEGEEKSICSVCGQEQVRAIPKIDHSFGEWKELKKATCEEEGEREHTCTVCKYKETQKIEKLPHDYETKIITEPTDHSAGVREKVCKKCKHSEGKEEFDPEGTLRIGDKGDAVYRMQQLLADQNYLNVDGVDGNFGAGTEKALMAFQKDHGFTPDGVAWPQTLKRLDHDFGPWETITKVTRTTAGERVRTCKDCNFEQHETIEPSPSVESGRRGEDVRAIQQMLLALGFDPGTIDGIYGQKLDAAYGAFAAENEVEFEAGKLNAANIDALVNAWIGSFSETEEMKESTDDDPVNLALTVTPFREDVVDESDDLMTYSWSVTNLGEEGCLFNLLLLNYGDEPDFTKDNYVMAIDGVYLEPNCANSASGTIQVSKDWNPEDIHFTAFAVSEQNAQKWLSNVVTFEQPKEEETEAETENLVETEPETENVIEIVTETEKAG